MRGILCCLLVCVLIISPVVGENITYSPEYSNVVDAINTLFDKYVSLSGFLTVSDKINALEEHRQSLIMEKQNEILAEHNRLMAEQTILLRNKTPIQMKCIKTTMAADYAKVCMEWEFISV